VDELRFEREHRTPNSEAYLVLEEENRLGRIDLHFGNDMVFGTLIVEREMSEQEVQDLIEAIDDELVTSAQMPRDDFVVTVYQGKEVGVYSDEYMESDEEEEE
jgi:hypothetical protein